MSRMIMVGLMAVSMLSTAYGQAKPSSTKPGAKGTRAELDALVDRLGKTQPDWFKSTQVNYPTTLDLTWPMQAPQGGASRWLEQPEKCRSVLLGCCESESRTLERRGETDAPASDHAQG